MSMPPDNANPPNRPDWAVTLTPHRSLSRRGFITVMALIGGINFVAGMFFLAIGAWPVFGFCGLDVALIWWAFRANFKAADRAERIEINGDKVSLQRMQHSELAEVLLFNRRWVRVILERDEERELIGKLFLSSHGKRTEIAGFLGAEERQSLAIALKTALARG